MAKKIEKKEGLTKVSDLRKELLNLRFKKKSGQLENNSQFKKIRKEIARALTAKNKLSLKEKENA